jgi:hypothetical protein
MSRRPRHLIAVLEEYASSPDGLTTHDLEHLFWHCAERYRLGYAARITRDCADRGWVTESGDCRRPDGGRYAIRVHVITAEGREALAGLIAERDRVPARPLSAGQAARVRRRAAVFAALAAGFGPDTPEGERKEQALAMRDEGCWASDIALVFAIGAVAAQELIGETL